MSIVKSHLVEPSKRQKPVPVRLYLCKHLCQGITMHMNGLIVFQSTAQGWGLFWLYENVGNQHN